MDVSWYVAAYLETLRRARRAVAEHLGRPDGPGAVHALVRAVNTGQLEPEGSAGEVTYVVAGLECRLVVPGAGGVDLDVTAEGTEVFDVQLIQAFIGAIPAVPPAAELIEDACMELVEAGELATAPAHRFTLGDGAPAPGASLGPQ